MRTNLKRDSALLLILLLLSISCTSTFDFVNRGFALQNCSGSPCIDVRINGEGSIRLLLDFASDQSYLTTSAATQLKLKRPSHRSAADNNNIESIVIKSLGIGNQTFADVPIEVIDRSGMQTLSGGFRRVFPEGSGALSYKVFFGKSLTLDFPHQRMFLNQSTSFTQDHCSRIRIGRTGCFGHKTLVIYDLPVSGSLVAANLDLLMSLPVLETSPPPKETSPPPKETSPPPKDLDRSGVLTRYVEYDGAAVYEAGLIQFDSNSPFRGALLPFFRRQDLMDTVEGSDFSVAIGLKAFEKSVLTIDLSNMFICST